MAAKKIKLPEDAKLFGVERFEKYAKKHRIDVDISTYRVVIKHPKPNMKVITAEGVLPRKSPKTVEYCEIMNAFITNNRGKIIVGLLICYNGKNIRFDSKAKY